METITTSPQDSGSAIKLFLTWEDIYSLTADIQATYHPETKYWGIPRGGQIVAGMLGNAVDTPEEADVIVDDILNSGKTADAYALKYGKQIAILYDKRKLKDTRWIVFPWEVEDTLKEHEAIITRAIEVIGDSPNREGLKDTPKRVIKSWSHLFSGYKTDPKTLITTFEKGTYDQMIVLKDCEMYSTCEHHIQPFFGKIHIAYIPNTKVIGISKLARIAECFSRRLQIQERIGEQITDFIMEALEPKGVGCVIEARHFCMMARGIEKQNSYMITSSLKGVFLKKQEVKEEFLSFVRSKT